MTVPGYDLLTAVTPSASLLVQRNPGVLTLEGTNTWVLASPDSSGCIVVDPGQADEDGAGEPVEAGAEAHLAALLAARDTVNLVLLTHRHHDHGGLAGAVHSATGAPVRAVDPALCRGAGPLADGEVLAAAGVTVSTMLTPGHTADSTSFVLQDADRSPAAVLTGDMILGHGTTVVAHPDGVLAPYLHSIGALGALGEGRSLTVLPGHGPVLPSLAAVADFYLAHRRERLEQVRAALVTLGPDASPRDVVEHVYADVDEALWDAAELSVQAQLDYLRPPAG